MGSRRKASAIVAITGGGRRIKVTNEQKMK
jgi:hypothetical protein